MFRTLMITLFLSVGLMARGQKVDTIELGKTSAETTLKFVSNSGQPWGISVTGSKLPELLDDQPVKIEVYVAENDIRQLGSGYQKVAKTESGYQATAEIPFGDKVVFKTTDLWSISGSAATVKRKIEVSGQAPGGFSSSVYLRIDPSVAWTDLNCLAPGALYGDPTYDGERSVGGTANYRAKRFMMREDVLAAPLFGILFKNGSSVSVLNPSIKGDTTLEETRSNLPALTDARLKFGSLGAWQNGNSPVEFGFRYPGASASAMGNQSRWSRRYHPIDPKVEHQYQVSFRFGLDENFRDLTRNSWRWAWDTLNPPIYYIDVEQMRKVLIDNLAANVNTIDGRSAIPFVISTLHDLQQWNYVMVAMGFVGKNLECADQLLRESDRDPSERGQKMRASGLNMIDSLIKALPTVPLQGTGYDLSTGKPWDHDWTAPWLRNATEDMRVLLRAYKREKANGKDHPQWLAWVKQYSDWLIQQQRPDGSFPRRWKPGSSEVAEESGTSSYCPVPMLVLMTELTGDKKYQDSALKAAEYVWNSFGVRGLFIGGAIDNPNITDKEAGMLSLEAFLSLYESTKDAKWLDRAKAAADYTETWAWIWVVPMPIGATDDQLHWKTSAPAIGFQGITAMNSGSVDEYLDWSVPSYAKLYKYTNEKHYLDFARFLLHNTKQMVALPGRQYDMKGIGWQQEGWRMGPGGSGRGVSGHRFWLPWISANHLYGMSGLDEFDPALYKQLSTKP